MGGIRHRLNTPEELVNQKVVLRKSNTMKRRERKMQKDQPRDMEDRVSRFLEMRITERKNKVNEMKDQQYLKRQ